MKSQRTSAVYICGNSTKGKITTVDSLLGLRIHNVGGGGPFLYALGDEGCYDIINDGLKVSDKVFNSVSSGRKHSIALGVDDGNIYSWGAGSYGELGCGALQGPTTQPKMIRTAHGPFTMISSGSNHSVTVNTAGSIVGWGQNFEKQLGLYRKAESVINDPTTRSGILDNAHMERVMLVPRTLPFGYYNNLSVKKVACGSQFTMVITTTGEMYAWGAGECGQLGVGRTTYKDLPQQCMIPIEGKKKKKNKDTSVWIDVSCGDGHVIALSSSQKLYSWGFNKHGQCGLGHTDTVMEPTSISVIDVNTAATAAFNTEESIAGTESVDDSTIKSQQSSKSKPSSNQEKEDAVTSNSIDTLPPTQSVASVDGNGSLFGVDIVSLHADANSSAVVLSDGTLFTWGSGSNYRTMHPSTDSIGIPTKVAASLSDKISKFAFSSYHSVYLVYTKLSHLSPTVGPQKSMKQLRLHGSGFWDSSNILIKFTSITNAFIPTRSCMGKLSSAGVVVCKPPRLAEAGDYNVTISMNGHDFGSESGKLSAYPDPTINSVRPSIVDMRVLPDMPKSSKGAKKKGLDVIVVGTHFTSDNDDSKGKSKIILRLNNSLSNPPAFVETSGTLLPAPKEDSRSMSASEDESSMTSRVKKAKVERTIKGTFLKSDLMNIGDISIMTAQVSLNNGTDYSVESDDLLICHTFKPEKCFPPMIPTGIGGSVTVRGISLLPTSRVNYEVVIALSLPSPDTKNDKKSKKNDKKSDQKKGGKVLNMEGLCSITLPVEYIDTENLSMEFPPIDTFLSEFAAQNGYTILEQPLLEESAVGDVGGVEGEGDGDGDIEEGVEGEPSAAGSGTGDGGENGVGIDAEPSAVAVEEVEGNVNGEEIEKESPEVTELRKTLTNSPLILANIGFRFKEDKRQIGEELINLMMYAEYGCEVNNSFWWRGHANDEAIFTINSTIFASIHTRYDEVEIVISSSQMDRWSYVVPTLGKFTTIEGSSDVGVTACAPSFDMIEESIQNYLETEMAKGTLFSALETEGEAPLEGEVEPTATIEYQEPIDTEATVEADGDTEANGKIDAAVDGEQNEGAATDEEAVTTGTDALPKPDLQALKQSILDSLCIGVMLDSRTSPKSQHMCAMTVYDSFDLITSDDGKLDLSGSLGTELEFNIKPQQWMMPMDTSPTALIRIRGLNGEILICDASVTVTKEQFEEDDETVAEPLIENITITLTIPESLDPLEGENRTEIVEGEEAEEGAPLYYHMDISIDGGNHFQESTTPILCIA